MYNCETILENKEVLLDKRVNNAIVSIFIWNAKSTTVDVKDVTLDAGSSYISGSVLGKGGQWYIPVIKNNDVHIAHVEQPIYHDEEYDLVSCSDIQLYCKEDGTVHLLTNNLVYTLNEFGKMKSCGMNIQIPEDLQELL